MNIKKILIGGAAAGIMAVSSVLPAIADTLPSIDFEGSTYSIGNINGQDGWSALGSDGLGCAVYDEEVVANTYGYASFGAQAFRISNAVTSGCFGDQAFSKPLADEAGEASAENGGLSGGTRQNYFEASWDFASTTPGTEQPGLSVVASPDRGDGARMSWIQMADNSDGLDVNFYDYKIGANDPDACCLGFRYTNVASGLDSTLPHNIKLTMQFVDGQDNDIVKVYVDGSLVHTGNSWEDYFTQEEGNPTRTVDSILFRVSGTAAPDSDGEGLLIDNLNISSGPAPVGPPVDKNECKKGGWETFNNPTFKNQGQCVSYVQANEKAGKQN